MLEPSSPAFLALPEDVLLDICTYVSVIDLLSLKATCRVLHAFGSLDYLWHRIVPRLDLALETPPGTEVNDLTAVELQRIVVRGIGLDRNWRRAIPKIKRLTTLPNDDDRKYFDEVQLLSEWLITAERRRFQEHSITHMTLWSLIDTDDVYRTASFDINGRFKYFAVALQKGGDTATLAITLTFDRKEILKVYSLSLKGPLDRDSAIRKAPQLLGNISRPGTHSIIHEVDVHGFIVAATLVDFLDDVQGRSYQILFFNTNTTVRSLVKPQLSKTILRLAVKLYDQHVAVISVVHSSVFVHIYELPASMTKFTKQSSIPVVTDSPLETNQTEDFGPLIREYSTPQLPGPHDFFLSGGTYHRDARTAIFSLLAFRSFYDDNSTDSYIYEIALDFSPTEIPDTSYVTPRRFRTRGATSVDHMHVGCHGRAIWLEHHWEIEEVRLMRLSSEAGRHVAGVLLPSFPGLPFTPRSCQALAFDEIKGRICLGLITGELYILDF